MVVDVSGEPTFTRSRPRMLFEGPHFERGAVRSYDVSPAGNRFVMQIQVVRAPEPVTRIDILLNWFEELAELAPVPDHLQSLGACAILPQSSVELRALRPNLSCPFQPFQSIYLITYR